jgi:hypothetical protein
MSVVVGENAHVFFPVIGPDYSAQVRGQRLSSSGGNSHVITYTAIGLRRPSFYKCSWPWHQNRHIPGYHKHPSSNVSPLNLLNSNCQLEQWSSRLDSMSQFLCIASTSAQFPLRAKCPVQSPFLAWTRSMAIATQKLAKRTPGLRTTGSPGTAP